MASGYTKRLPTHPAGYVSSLGGGTFDQLEVVAQVDAVVETLEELKGGIITQCAMESGLGAKAIKDRAVQYCPEKTGALRESARVYSVGVMESAVTEGLAWPTGVGIANFNFKQKQQMVWEVSFGGGTVDYASTIHENEFGWTIHPDVNPEATDHWLKKAYDEYAEYIPRRIMDRVQAQIMKAGIAAMKRRRMPKAKPVYTDVVPF
jgi:hypothetical protein